MRASLARRRDLEELAHHPGLARPHVAGPPARTPAAHSPAAVLQLQRTAGNRAVTQMLSRAVATEEDEELHEDGLWALLEEAHIVTAEADAAVAEQQPEEEGPGRRALGILGPTAGDVGRFFHEATEGGLAGIAERGGAAAERGWDAVKTHAQQAGGWTADKA